MASPEALGYVIGRRAAAAAVAVAVVVGLQSESGQRTSTLVVMG